MRPRPIRPALFLCALTLCVGLAAEAADLARVVRALDGDSLLLADGREVRLLGINTPEFGRDGAPPQPLAREARERADTLARGRLVQLRYGRERRDRYGRTLAYVTLPDGRDLQQILLEEGLAWFVAVAPNVEHVVAHRAAEGRARRARRGVWSRQEYAPIPATRLARDQTGFRRIAGTVRAVRVRGETLELRLAPHSRVLVPRTVASVFGPSLLGRHVVVRGWVSGYKRMLRLRLTHPSMLELVS